MVVHSDLGIYNPISGRSFVGGRLALLLVFIYENNNLPCNTFPSGSMWDLHFLLNIDVGPSSVRLVLTVVGV